MVRHTLALLALLPIWCAAQAPGSIDPTFNADDQGRHLGYGVSGSAYAAVRQPDGKLIIGGWLNKYNGTPTQGLVRITTNGLLDTTFQLNAGLTWGMVNAMAIQPDGRVVVGGSFVAFGPDTVNNLVRVMPDGTRDTTFDVGSGFDGVVRSIAIQPDGKIVVAGDFDTLNGAPYSGIARLLADGMADPAFSIGTGFLPVSANKVNHVLVQPDGKIFCSGGFYTYNGASSQCFARLNSNGTLDATFVPQTIAGVPLCAARQADGRYIVGGWFIQYSGTMVGRIMRLMPNGTLDTSYNTGTGFNYDVKCLVLQPDGKAIIGGQFTTFNGASRTNLARLLTTGALDPTFTGTGMEGHYDVADDAMVKSLVLEPSGSFFATGEFLHCDGRTAVCVAHLMGNGTLDPAYNPGQGVLGFLFDVAVQPDGRVLAAGRVHGYDGIEQHSLFRTLSDGELDTAFHCAIQFGYGLHEAQILRLQPDGRILVAGAFNVAGDNATRLARLMPDGALDTTFAPCLGGATTINDLEVLTDGRIVVAGDFTSYNGATCDNIARLWPDGTLDTSFQAFPAFNDAVNRIAVQSDGRIICGGSFSAHAGSTAIRLARLNPGGAFDPTYITGTGLAGNVKDIELLPDDRAVILGAGIYNGVWLPGGMRLNTDGSLDTTFNLEYGGAGSSSISDLEVLPDGRLLVGGLIGAPTCNGNVSGVVRLQANGGCDTTFAAHLGQPYASAYAIAVQADGAIVVGGTFSEWEGLGRNSFARILGGDISTTTGGLPRPGSTMAIFPNPFWATTLNVTNLPKGARTLRILDILGRAVRDFPLDGDTNWSGELRLPAGIYMVTAGEGPTQCTTRLIVR